MTNRNLPYRSKLKEILDSRGTKYSWLAERVNIAPSSLNRIIKGQIPGVDVALEISRVLGMRVDEIWIREGE